MAGRVAYYNFGRVHMTLKTQTTAIASGLADYAWMIRELTKESVKFWQSGLETEGAGR